MFALCNLAVFLPTVQGDAAITGKFDAELFRESLVQEYKTTFYRSPWITALFLKVRMRSLQVKHKLNLSPVHIYNPSHHGSIHISSVSMCDVFAIPGSVLCTAKSSTILRIYISVVKISPVFCTLECLYSSTRRSPLHSTPGRPCCVWVNRSLYF